MPFHFCFIFPWGQLLKKRLCSLLELYFSFMRRSQKFGKDILSREAKTEEVTKVFLLNGRKKRGV